MAGLLTESGLRLSRVSPLARSRARASTEALALYERLLAA
jgi:hypothetical protein